MEKIEKLNLVELKVILKWLKLYKDLTKKLWNRWKSVFNRELSWKNTYKVEYISTSSLDSVWEKASIAFEKAFWKAPKREKIKFVENNSILGWIKIFKNDDMVDLSLSKAVNQIK